MEPGIVYEEDFFTRKNNHVQVKVKYLFVDTYVLWWCIGGTTQRELLPEDTTYGQAIRLGIKKYDELFAKLGKKRP